MNFEQPIPENEQEAGPRDFPPGFIVVSGYETVQDYENKGLTVPKIGTYCFEGNNVVTVNADGEVRARHIPEDPSKSFRGATGEDVLRQLEAAGYTEANNRYYVPSPEVF